MNMGNWNPTMGYELVKICTSCAEHGQWISHTTRTEGEKSYYVGTCACGNVEDIADVIE